MTQEKKRKTLTLNEYYVGNDLVLYNDLNVIVGWMIQSDSLGEYFSVPLEVIKREKPTKYNEMQNKIENLPEDDHQEASVDFEIDQNRDDNLKGAG